MVQCVLQVRIDSFRVKFMDTPRKATTKNSQLLTVARGAANQRAMLVSVVDKLHGACPSCDSSHHPKGLHSVDSLVKSTPSSTGSGTARLSLLLASLARAIPLAELLLPLAVCGHLAHCLDVLRLKDEAAILEEVYA